MHGENIRYVKGCNKMQPFYNTKCEFLLTLFNMKLLHTIAQLNNRKKRHEFILSSPCLFLCIILSYESRFKPFMSVWYKCTHQYIKRKFKRYLDGFKTNTQSLSCSLIRG